MRKICFVPSCRSNSVSTPDKQFFSAPRNMKLRKAWFTVIGKQNVPSGRAHFCCEDHFVFPDDAANWLKFKLMKGTAIKLKDGAVPHKNLIRKRKLGGVPATLTVPPESQEQFSRTSVDGDQESSKNVDEDSFRVEPNTISIYCRLCLKPASSETVTPLCVVDCNYSGKSEASKKKKLEEIEEIQTMIKLCLPFFDSLTSNPVICCLCLTNLKTSYVFISQCVKTQKFISEYVNTFAVTEMSLTDVVDSNFIASSKKVNVANTLDSSQQVNTRVANSRVIDMFQSDLIPPNKQAENESNVVMNPAVATIPARGVQTDGHNEAVCYNNSSSSKRSKPQNPYEETLESTMASSEEVFVKIEPYGDSFQATVDSIKIETDIDILESTMTSGQKVVVKIEPDGDNFESTVDSTKIETNKQTLESPVTSSEEIILKTELDGDSLKSTIGSIKMEMDFIDYIDFGKTELIDVGRIDNIGKNSND